MKHAELYIIHVLSNSVSVDIYMATNQLVVQESLRANKPTYSPRMSQKNDKKKQQQQLSVAAIANNPALYYVNLWQVKVTYVSMSTSGDSHLLRLSLVVIRVNRI